MREAQSERGESQLLKSRLGAPLEYHKVCHLPGNSVLPAAGLQPDQLPDIVIEAEAEYSRRRGWERVFPCPEDPRRCDWEGHQR
jgi:hypothetical protein